MTLTTIAKASAIYMLAAILYAGGHAVWQSLSAVPPSSAYAEAGL